MGPGHTDGQLVTQVLDPGADPGEYSAGRAAATRPAVAQDRKVQESMGPLFDRSQEHLGTSDAMILAGLLTSQPVRRSRTA